MNRHRVLGALAFVLGSAPYCAPPPALPTPRGSIEGWVRVPENFELGAPRVILNTTDPEVCGERQELEEVIVDPGHRGLANVIASVMGIAAEPSAPAKVTLDNRECRFAPHVAVTTVGSLIEAVNSDAVLHTTHLYGPHEMNVSLPILGARQTRVIGAPGMFVVKCDVHGWMQAYLRVDEHPYHAVTDNSGFFRIEGVPEGAHEIEIWHERFGTLRREITIAGEQTTTVELELGEENLR